MVFMIEKLLALAPKSTNRQLHFFVPFNFGVYLFLSMLQILIKIQNTSTWIHSKEGEKILQIEQWIKKARCSLTSDFPNAMIYIGRSFINPVSLIIGGYVENQSIEEFFKKYFNNLCPPIKIDYKISLFS